MCIDVLNRGKLRTVGGDVFVTADFPLNEREGVYDGKLGHDILSIIPEHETGNADYGKQCNWFVVPFSFGPLIQIAEEPM